MIQVLGPFLSCLQFTRLNCGVYVAVCDTQSLAFFFLRSSLRVVHKPTTQRLARPGIEMYACKREY